jgi:hypothetical protein
MAGSRPIYTTVHSGAANELWDEANGSDERENNSQWNSEATHNILTSHSRTPEINPSSIILELHVTTELEAKYWLLHFLNNLLCLYWIVLKRERERGWALAH